MIESKVPGMKIVEYTRYKRGDGLEKKVNDLAAEVAEQINKTSARLQRERVKRVPFFQACAPFPVQARIR